VRKKIKADLKKKIIIFLCVDFFVLQAAVILTIDKERKMGKSYFRSTNFLNRRQHMKPNADSDGGVWNPRTVITPSCSVHPYSL
jgi:hypothetical protein